MIIVAAKPEELAILSDDEINNADAIVITGVGGMNAVRKMAKYCDPAEEDILNVGYVGSNNIEIGTVVQIGGVQLHHPGVKYSEKPIMLEPYDITKPAVACFTSTDFVTSTNITEPAVFDMELAFLAAMGFRSISSVKKVSDNLNLKQYEANCNERSKDND